MRTTASWATIWATRTEAAQDTSADEAGALPSVAASASPWTIAPVAKTGVCDAAHSLPLSDPLQALGGRRRCQSSVMTTLPLARPCSTYASASRVWSNGNVLSMSGRRWPAS